MGNPITDEIRQTRHRLAAECGNDVYRIGEELRRQEQKSGHKVVRLPKRNPAPITTNQAMHPSGGGSPFRSGDSTAAAG